MITNDGGRGVGDPLGGPGRGQRCPRTLPTAAPPPPRSATRPVQHTFPVPGARPDTWPSLKMRAAGGGGPRQAAGRPGVFRLRSETRRVASLSLARASYIAPAAASLRGPAWPRRRPRGNPGCCGSGWQAEKVSMRLRATCLFPYYNLRVLCIIHFISIDSPLILLIFMY